MSYVIHVWVDMWVNNHSMRDPYFLPAVNMIVNKINIQRVRYHFPCTCATIHIHNAMHRVWRHGRTLREWSPGNSPHKGQWRRALMFSLICGWINGWLNDHEANDLRRHHAHYDVTVMVLLIVTYGLPVAIFMTCLVITVSQRPFLQLRC